MGFQLAGEPSEVCQEAFLPCFLELPPRREAVPGSPSLLPARQGCAGRREASCQVRGHRSGLFIDCGPGAAAFVQAGNWPHLRWPDQKRFGAGP